MNALRKPKRQSPERSCWRCKHWKPCRLDWGECFWVAEAVPGDEYRMTYAYGECFFERGVFDEKEER